jgi:hypothetical protein
MDDLNQLIESRGNMIMNAQTNPPDICTPTQITRRPVPRTYPHTDTNHGSKATTEREPKTQCAHCFTILHYCLGHESNKEQLMG